MPTAKEIQARIAEIRKRADEQDKQFQLGSARENITNMRLDIVALSLQLGEISTQRIVKLTKALAWLTLSLLIVSIVTLVVIFKQDAQTHAQPVQASQNQ